MTVINTNVKSIVAQNALSVNNRKLADAMQQLSTGKRINSAKDDAAGLAISEKMTSQIRGLSQAVRNANDGISLAQTAEGALIEVTNMLQRMRELAIQSANDTNTSTERSSLDLEFQQLKSEINRIGNNTQFNGMDILDKSFASGSGTFVFQVGANASQTISLSIGDFRTLGGGSGIAAVATTTGAATSAAQVSTLTIGGTYAAGDVISINVGDKQIQYEVTAANMAAGTPVNDIAASINTALGTITGVGKAVAGAVITFTASANNTPFEISAAPSGLLGNIHSTTITSQSASNSAVGAVDVALNAVNSARATMGATINRLTYAADNLTTTATNAAESRSRIEDTDYAAATTELARGQIIQQAATAMLAQANQLPQTVLSLLQ
jgi:flagellin